MWRLFLNLVFLASLSHGYKNCTDIPYCNKFRNQQLPADAQFQANILNITPGNNVAIVPLSNKNGDILTLQLSLLENGKSRIRVLDANQQRYELVDVLVSEPKLVSYDLSTDDTAATLTPKDGQSYKVKVNQGPPFTIQFYKEDDLEVTFDASRLVVENTEDSQSFHFDVIFEGSSNGLYGLYHHCHRIHLKETADGSSEPFRLRNTDAGWYQPGSTNALYGSIPALFGHSADKTAGVFLHNAAEQWVDINYNDIINPSAHFMADSGSLDLFVLLGPTPKDTVKQLTDLTGKAHLPQFWALGYHQCRYSYWSQDDVKSVIDNMDKANFPMDVIWLDIGYTDNQRYFLWNQTSFPDPVEMQEYIASTNRKLVTLNDCHVRIDETYFIYNDAKGKYFVQNPDGSDFQGDCWPGASHWFDYLNSEAQNYWAGLYSYETFNGSTPTLAGTWNDMNEPALFNAGENDNSVPNTVIHKGPNGPVVHRDIHNIYGLLQTKASHHGLLQRDDGKVRPFILTRSHFAGSHRYAAHWTGDNVPTFGHLSSSYSECMLANILGYVYCGADIGGFLGNPTDELLQRWYQAATWIPFYRGHSDSWTNRREPYLFDESVQQVIRQAMRVRYKHIPTFYTLFYLHVRNGDPIIRPLFYEYPGLFDYDEQILVGTDIMGAPVMKEGATDVAVTFPGYSNVQWYKVDLDIVTLHTGGTSQFFNASIDTSPYFYRAGSIVTTKNIERKSTLDMLDDPYTLNVNLDVNSYAEGLFYDDDHVSFEYENGAFFFLNLTSNGANVEISKLEGDMDPNFKISEIIVHQISDKDPGSVITKVYNTTVDGTPLKNIDIGYHIKKMDNSNGYTLYLE